MPTGLPHDASADPFAAPAGEWVRVQPALRTVRLITLAVVGLPLAVAATVAAAYFLGLAPAVVVALIALLALLLAVRVIHRGVKAWGYLESADDLLVTRGVAWRRLTVVPYGRMQLVDLTEGPLYRRFGLARLRLHTAAATTDATIPGIAAGEAARLRERLTALGEVRLSGL